MSRFLLPLQFCSSAVTEKSGKNTFTFLENFIKKYSGRSVVSMFLSHLERWPSTELFKEKYKTALVCEALMNRF